MTMPTPPPRVCSQADTSDEALNLFVDGELASEAQPALFAHLAECAGCRQTLEAVMHFRRMSRQETLDVPPAADDAFFKRLDAVKKSERRPNRAADRRPLWQARAPLSVRAVAMTAVLFFLTGLLVPVPTGDALPLPPVYIEAHQEGVDEARPVRREAVYVFYPGLTVEASQGDEAVESL